MHATDLMPLVQSFFGPDLLARATAAHSLLLSLCIRIPGCPGCFCSPRIRVGWHRVSDRSSDIERFFRFGLRCGMASLPVYALRRPKVRQFMPRLSDQTRAVQAALWPRPPCQPRASRGRPQTGRLPRRCVALQLPPTEVARSAELASTLPFVPSAHCRKTACAPGLQAWEDRPGLVAGGLGLGLSSRSGCQNSSLHGSASFTFSYRCSGRALTRKRRQRQLELIIDNRRRTCLRHEAGGLRSAHAPP